MSSPHSCPFVWYYLSLCPKINFGLQFPLLRKWIITINYTHHRCNHGERILKYVHTMQGKILKLTIKNLNLVSIWNHKFTNKKKSTLQDSFEQESVSLELLDGRNVCGTFFHCWSFKCQKKTSTAWMMLHLSHSHEHLENIAFSSKKNSSLSAQESTSAALWDFNLGAG